LIDEYNLDFTDFDIDEFIPDNIDAIDDEGFSEE
jgi:hypothetical protein